jgi:RNA polymerase sigma factor (sigma-70 family)
MHESDDGREEMRLAQRAAAGDHEAFRAIVMRYEERLLAFLTQMIGEPEAARDAAQETFIAAFRALSGWQPPVTGDPVHPLAPWLYRIAANQALSQMRRAAAHPSTPLLALENVAHPQHAWEERFAARELLRQALSELTAEDAACLVLHYVAGERYGEIAARLGLTGEAVRKRVSRGLVALRAAYARLDVEVFP